MPGQDFVHVQDYVNTHIVCMFGGIFSLDIAQLMPVLFFFQGYGMLQYIEHALFTIFLAVLISIYYRKGQKYFMKVIVLALKVGITM